MFGLCSESAALDQQTTLERGVLRGMTVTPPTYPGVSYACCCLFRCLASAGEERGTQSPNMEATSPTESDVMSIVAKRMASSIDSCPAPRQRGPISPAMPRTQNDAGNQLLPRHWAYFRTAKPRIFSHQKLYMRFAAASDRLQPVRFPCASNRLARAKVAAKLACARSSARFTEPGVGWRSICAPIDCGAIGPAFGFPADWRTACSNCKIAVVHGPACAGTMPIKTAAAIKAALAFMTSPAFCFSSRTQRCAASRSSC
jgi:hypothetical protein